MFNPEVAMRLIVDNEIIGVVRWVRVSSKLKFKQGLYACIFVAPALHSDDDLISAILQAVMFKANLAHRRYNVPIYYITSWDRYMLTYGVISGERQGSIVRRSRSQNGTRRTMDRLPS
jgi:hypothetical protein